ncbi:Photosystem I chlorophyll a apoprotein A1 [Sesamum angolense]|uniref:Photosystem I chlorophyll a apoprotein A1 n=1 Tax=Sesamum angolense TaxID=2727404 RepID=A0AAE1T7Z1_9LAMI|nr:Photosystem I chlorophyll a apoprotein A1 [Sesamum angolense]
MQKDGDFDGHTSDLEEISRKVFSAHFGQLSIIFLWLSGMYFHGARFSNYEAWLSDPTHIGPSAQVVWPIVGQEILNGDVGIRVFMIQSKFASFSIRPCSGFFRGYYLLGFIMTGAFAHGAIFFIRDYNPEQNEDNVLARMLLVAPPSANRLHAFGLLACIRVPSS